MTDKEKIRTEVERLMNELIQEKEKGFGSDIDDACILELQNVLTFIDSMQEETINEDLEEEWKRYITSEEYLNDIPGGLPVARHFAEWQKHQIMKAAIEVEIIDPGTYTIIKTKDDTVLYGRYGDKVKLITIKED